MCRIDRAKQGDPAPPVQRAIENHQDDRGQQRRRTGPAQRVDNRAEIGLPQNDRGENDGDQQADRPPA